MTVITVLTMIGYTLWYTALFSPRRIEVSGTSALTPTEIRAAAAIDPDTPILRLDTVEVATRIRTLPRVDDVVAEVSWPSTVRLTVTERVPVYQARVSGGGALVDHTGLVFATEAAPTPGIPELVVARIAPDDDATRAALIFLAALPERTRAEVLSVRVDTPGALRATLAAGREVIWGTPERVVRKAAVLTALLSRPGRIYNVSTPDLPTVTP
jgi:cell division protein FtsQ